MEMIYGELRGWMYAFLVGAFLRAVYGGIRLKRSIFPGGKVLRAVEDLLYWLFGAAVLFILWQDYFLGIPRVYGYVAVILGMYLFYQGPEQILYKVFVKCVADPLKKYVKLIKLKAKLRRKETEPHESEDKVQSKGT